MNSREINRHVRTFLIARLAFITALLGTIIYFKLHIKGIETKTLLIGALLLLYVLPILFSIFYKQWKLSAIGIKRLAYLQFFLDSVLVIGLILITGGIESWFSFLLILITLSASIVLGRKAGYIIAAINGILYGLTLDLQYYRILTVHYSPELDEKSFLYNITVNILGLYLTAYLTSYLARRLEKTSETLEKRDTDLRELSRFHLEVINNIPSGLFTTNTDGRITLFNPAAERLTGLVKKEVLGRAITDVFPFLTIPPPLGRIEGSIRTENGDEIFVGMNISLNKDTTGKTAGFIGTFQDLTNIIRMEEEIKRKEKLAAIGELSASIAHELRNPLASIKSSFEMIREGHLGDETKNRLMEIALTEMDRLNSIVTDFLLYSNPKPPEFSRFDLSRLMRDIVMVAENLNDDIKISLSLPETPLIIKGDQQRIRQLLWNLTTNALEAIEGAGSISISADTDGSEVLISIKDTGRGIPDDILPRIFYPFFSTRAKGTGLGLAIAYRIVEEHNGNIKVNTRLGEGTEFIIRLPLSEEMN